MMSKVTALTRSIDQDLIRKLFQKFANVYGQLWSSRCSTPSEWEDCVNTWLDGVKGFEFEVLRKAVNQSFLVHKDYPPTLGQLVDICLHVSGVPSESEVIDAMVRKDFNHPLIKVIYDKVGNWALSHGKPEDIRAKVRNVYGPSLSSFRENPTQAWELLESFKALPPPAPIPSKIPTEDELLSFKDRLKKWQELSAVEKANLKPESHPVWDKNAITWGHGKFDHKVYEARKHYLTNLDELVASTLSHDDQYDRIRFIREDIARRSVEKHRADNPQPEQEKVPPRSYNSARKVYKHWGQD